MLKNPRVPWLVDHGLALAWSLFLALALTWPMPLHPGQAALGHPGADGLKHLWTLWWVRASVWREGRFPFHTDLVNFPTGMDLFPIEPLNGLVAVALPDLDLVLLRNLLVLVNLALTGVAGAWLGRVLTGRQVGGLVVATLLEGSSVAAFFVHVGVGELLHLWWLPLGLGVAIRARETGSWSLFLALAGVLVGAFLSGFYLGLFLALAVATWAACTLGAPRGWPALLPRYAAAAALALAVVLPVTRVFATSYPLHGGVDGDRASMVAGAQGQRAVDPPSARLEPIQVLRRARPPADEARAAYSGGRYLGWIAIGLALVGLVRQPRKAGPFLAIAALGFVLALGSYLTVDGATVTFQGRGYRLPGLWLNRLLAVAAEPVNFPVRFLALTAMGLAGMAAHAVRGWGGLLAPLAALEIAWCQQVPRPWATFALPDVQGLAPVAEQFPGEGVLDLSFTVDPSLPARRTSLAAQIAHQHPVQTMPVERVEYFGRDGVWMARALPAYEALRAAVKGEAQALTAEDAAATLALLEARALRLVLVHDADTEQPLNPAITDLLTRLCGPPIVIDRTTGLWRVPDQGAAPEDLRRWETQLARDTKRQRREDSRLARPLR